MSEGDITEFLNKNKGWHNSREISKGISIGINSVQKSLRHLRKTKFIVFEPIPKKNDFKYKGVEKHD